MKDYSYESSIMNSSCVGSDRLVKGLSDIDRINGLIRCLPIVDEDTADFKRDLLDNIDEYKKELLVECYKRGLVKLSSGED